jgi:uncharacterized membrane protein YgdD (TMEM256/DUF423 family)
MNALPRYSLVLGSFSAGLAVAFGAFGAHALKTRLEPALLVIFETGVRYQMYHALALLFTGLLYLREPQLPGGRYLPVLFGLGSLIFSGSLYLLALTGVRTWGAVTPVGGVILLLGWLTLTVSLLKS